MKIICKNFKCHVDRTFEFPDEGFFLINGKNGQGKSTILEAIFYAFYGNMKKPYSFGKTTCSVEVFYGGMHITRTNRPNRLVLDIAGETFEDDVAQYEINRQVGNIHEFIAGSYIKQKSTTSILSLTPTEQLQFIKNIAFDVNTNENIKAGIKDYIKDTNEDIIRIKKDIELANSQLEELNSKEYPIVENPLGTTSEEKFEANFAKLGEIISQLQKRKKDKELELQKVEKLEKSTQKILDKKTECECQLQKLEDDLNNAERPDEEAYIEKQRSRLAEIEPLYEQHREYDTYLEYDQMLVEEREEYETRRENRRAELEQYILPNYEEIQHQQQEYLLYQKFHKKLPQVLKLIAAEFPDCDTSDIPSVIELLNEANAKQIYKCPGCGVHVALDSDNLVIAKKKKTITVGKTYNDWLQILRGAEKYKDMRDQQEILDNHDVAESELKKIDIVPKNIQELESKVAELSHVTQPETDGIQLYDEICAINNYLEEQSQLGDNIETLASMVEKKKMDIAEMEKLLGDNKVSAEQLRKQIMMTSEKLSQNLLKLDKYNNMRYQLQEYHIYCKALEDVEKWEKRLETYEKNLERTTKKYENLVILRDKSNQAELLAIENTIEDMNEYAKRFLDIMFPVDSMSIRVENYKQTKKDLRNKMSVIIQYKGCEYDNIDQLSGGERQKCELAFELAVNCLLQSKLLFLDECINNLDPEVNAEILEMLREYSHDYNKLLLVVSHECITGLFDDIYNI